MSGVDLREQFASFGESAGRDGAGVYAAICAFAADDPELLALMAQAPLSQRRPNLLLAAVHYLLLGGADHPLADYYDTVGVYCERPRAARDTDVGPIFKDFCLTHRDELETLVATKCTQTNEIGRCTALLPALSLIVDRCRGARLGLLDLGTSAGLNLLFDHYAYHYVHAASNGEVATSLTAGDPKSPVNLECTVLHPLSELPSLTTPALADRAGLDRSPIDPHDAAGSRWLLACLWPGNLPRFDRLRQALRIARTTPGAPSLHTGDMIDDLQSVAASLAPGLPLVIFHSWVAAYLSEARQRELLDAIRAYQEGSTRAVHYLFAESPVETPGLGIPDAPEAHRRQHVVTALVHLGPGPNATMVRLADMHHHGRTLRWWPQP